MTSPANTTVSFKCDGAVSRATPAVPERTLQTLTGWLTRSVKGLRDLAPYAAIELLLPGGSLMVLGLWLFRRQKARRKTPMPANLSVGAAVVASVAEFGALNIVQ